MRPILFLTLTSLSLFFAGCASNSLVGTWQGRGDAAERPFTFGSVTFAPDGTYTAEAKYGEKTRVQTGRYTETKNAVTLNDVKRSYNLDFKNSEVVFTDPSTGKSMTLDRFK